MRKSLFTALAGWAALTATAAHAQAAPKACLTSAQAESVFLLIAPAALQSMADLCKPRLPQGAFFHSSAPMIAKYQAAAKNAGPGAIEAIGIIAGPDAAKLMTPAMVDMMVGSMIGPMLTEKIKPESCGAIDRGLMLIEPLPAKNAAGLIVLLAQIGVDQKGRETFPICPLGK